MIVYCNNDKAPEGFIRNIKLNDTKAFPVDRTSYIGFSKVNIFVGSNNSGKSRLLRYMFSSENSFSKIEDNFCEFLWNSVDIRRLLLTYYGTDVNRDNIFKFFINFLEEEYIHSMRNGDIKLHKNNILSDRFFTLLYNSSENTPAKKIVSKKMYIPILRSLCPILMNREDAIATSSTFKYTNAYRRRTIKQYSHILNNSDSENKIFTGQEIRKQLEELHNGDESQRNLKEEFENFLSEHIFEGEKILLLSRGGSDTVWVKIGEKPEREIHNLGDGVQALILLTFPIYMNRDNDMMFFIEEPETNMHPGMQRIFMNALLNFGFDKHHYFFTTHSNHLLDMVFDHNDISIFMFTKTEAENDDNKLEVFNVENVDNGDVRLLKELGVNDSSVFMSNCTIWVEGITDRPYIREYLIKQMEKENDDEAEKEHFVEGLHYSFVEYGGSSISHLEYKNIGEALVDESNTNIKNITNKPIIVADFDSEDKQSLHENRKLKLGDKNYYYLDGVKEVENTLHENILKCVIAEYEKKDIIEINTLFENVEQNDYKNEPLGIFINEKLGTSKKRISSYADTYKKDGNVIDGKTIADKTAFAQKACAYIRENDYEKSMSESAIKLTKKLMQFIKRSNESILNI